MVHMDEDAIVKPIILYVNIILIWRKEVKNLKQNQAFVCTTVGWALLKSYNVGENVKFKTAMANVLSKSLCETKYCNFGGREFEWAKTKGIHLAIIWHLYLDVLSES